MAIVPMDGSSTSRTAYGRIHETEGKPQNAPHHDATDYKNANQPPNRSGPPVSPRCRWHLLPEPL